jgi:hypothetical protein
MSLKLKLRDKLIAFPEDVLDVLSDYKEKTGVSASNYIRNATIRRMIQDKLIWFSMKTIDVETKSNGKKYSNLSDAEGNEANKYCDGDSCEALPPQMEKC